MARLSCCLLPLIVLVTDASAAPPEDTYIGSRTCYGCHADIYRSYLKTDMGRSMRRAADLDTASLPAEATVHLQGSNRDLRVFGERAGRYQSESEPSVSEYKH